MEVGKVKMNVSVPPLVLISEFVTVDHGKYIVKVSCHSNNAIIGTALAGADTVEQAEDNARKRVLDLVNQGTQGYQSPQNNNSQIRVTPGAISPSNAIVTSTDQSRTTTPISSVSSGTPSPTTEKNLVITPPSPTTIGNISPKTPQEPPIVNNSSTVEASVKTNDDRSVDSNSNDRNENNDTQLSIVSPTSEGTRTPAPTPTLDPTSEGTRTPTPDPIPSGTETPTPAEDQPQLDLMATTPAEPEPSNVDSSPSTGANTPSASTTSAENLDFSEIISLTNIQMKRLGWTAEDGRKFLLDTYGQKTRHLLSDEQLVEFLHYLEKQ